jgi:hypothetical protein
LIFALLFWPLFSPLVALTVTAAIELPRKPMKEDGGNMKKQVFGTLTMLTLMLALTVISVSAQSERSKITNIPFSFTVGEKTLPAGDYTIEPYRRDFDKVWLVQSRDGRTSALFTTMPVRARETQEKSRFVFHKYGDQYFLSQIWTPGDAAGRELPRLRPERELAKNAVESQTIVLAGGPAARR